MTVSPPSRRPQPDCFPASRRGAAKLLPDLCRAGLFLLGTVAIACAAEPELLGPAFNLVAENDMVVRTDRHYTHGTKFTLLDPRWRWRARRVDFTSQSGWLNTRRTFGPSRLPRALE